MSGHSKWNNIKRKKGAADAAKGKIFTKLGREIQMAVKNGGPDPSVNATLKDVIAKCKSNNMPNDSIQRSISKASGADDGTQYEVIMYEGYGPGGIAVMVRAMTDNRNRTAGEVRHAFDKFGGNLGTSGCVGYLFEEKGQMILTREDYEDEEQVMMDAIEAGAEDVQVEDELYTIVATPEDYHSVRDALEDKGYKFFDVSLGPVPLTWNQLASEEDQEKMQKLIDKLEDDDDVTDVWHNWDQD